MKVSTIFLVVMAAVSTYGESISSWGEYAGENEGGFVVKITKDDEYLCMGTILYPQWVLTTAHCLENENITITAGSNSFSDSSRRSQSSLQSRLVSSKRYYVVHPLYTPKDSGSVNIGLVYLEEPFNLTISPRVSRIWLPIDVFRQKSGRVFSWGERRYIFPVAANLHITNVSEINHNDYCVAWALQPKLPYLLCSSGHGSRCYLDEGGPLVATTFKGTTVVGIVNTQITEKPEPHACNIYAPTHYTSVPYFVRWLFDVVSFFVLPDN